VAIALLAIGLGLPGSVAAQDAPAVAVQDNSFNPMQVQVSSGGTVTWTNTGAVPHTVTADDGSFDSGVIAAGGTFSFTPPGPGTYAYYCQFHGGPGGEGMAGTINAGS
jgi:plastocyanin